MPPIMGILLAALLPQRDLMKAQTQIYCSLKNCVNLKEGSAPSAACAFRRRGIQPFHGCSNHHAER